MSQKNGINDITAAYQADRPALSAAQAPQNLVSGDPVQQLLANLDLWTGTVTEKTGGRGRSSAAKKGGASKGTELSGIKRLRELILELAVRGKLVKQNPNDEPASALLQRIEAEKAQLVKDGKIKKPKKLPPVSDDEQPFELPEGWEWERLANITDIQSGIAKGKKYSGQATIELPYLRVANVQRGFLVLDELKEIEILAADKEKYSVLPRDLLITEGGDWDKVGRTAIWPEYSGDMLHQNHVFKARLIMNSQNERWLECYLNGPVARSYFAGSSKQTTNLASINKTQLSNCLISLPPLAEQQRIVERVDQLMALCDQLEQGCQQQLDNHQQLVDTLMAELTAAESSPDGQTLESEPNTNPAWQRIHDQFDRLFSGAIQTSVQAENGRLGSGEALPNAQPILVGTGNSDWAIDRLKETILQLAVMGRLVDQDKNDEPASQLLQRIDAEKAQLVKDGKIKKPKKLPPISDDEKPFQLPEGWEWVRLSRVLPKITDGTHHSPTNTEAGDFLYISAKNIKNEGVLLSNATYVTKEVHEEIFARCNPEFGDILYIKDGATTGVTTLNNLSEPFSMLSSVALLKVLPELNNNQFLLNALRSPMFYDAMRSGMTGVAITRVTLKKLELAALPLPPLAEQQRIVERVDQLFALCDQLKAKQQDANHTRQQLTEALTAKLLTFI